MKNRNIYGNIRGYGPFDKLRKKRTGSIYDATTRYGGKIDLPAIAGVVEAGRRTNRKAGETNENRIEEAAERLDARARSVAGNEQYGGPKFNAATFATENNIDMNLRFDPKNAHPDPIVANPPRILTPPKAKPRPSAAAILYPNEKPGPRSSMPRPPAAPRAADKQGGLRKKSPAEILYPNERGRRDFVTSPPLPTPAKPAKKIKKPDPLSKHDPAFDSQQLRAEQRRMLTDPAPTESQNQPETPMGRLESGLGQFGQGFIEIVSAIPKSFGVAKKNSALQILEIYHQYESGDADIGPISASRLKSFNAHKFRKAGETERNRILREIELTAFAPITEIPAYRTGEDMQEWAKRVFPTNEAYAGELAQRLARGGGAAAAFVLMGIVARGAGLGVTAGAAATGAIVGSVEGFDDALANGASFEDAYRSGQWNALVGATNGIPIMKALDRYDRITGGSVKQLFKRAAKGFTEGSMRNTLEQISQNLVAAELVKYDTERGTWEGVADAGLIGGIISGVMNAANPGAK